MKKMISRRNFLKVAGASAAALGLAGRGGASPSPRRAPPIRYGSRGDGVRWIQYMLDAAGYDCGKIDGIAGVKTIAAIRAYQQEHGLDVDGLAGKKTVAALAGE